MDLDEKSQLTMTQPEQRDAPAHHRIALTKGLLSDSRISRNRVLAGAGAALTAAAVKLWFPETASALLPTPNGCYPAGTNLGCNQCTPWCTPNCTAHNGSCPPVGGGNCWYTCAYEGCCLYKFRCCDFNNSSGQFCECRAYIGPC